MNRTDINRIWLTEDAIFVEDKNGNQAFERFANYIRLKDATLYQRQNYTVSHFGIHWPELDEDLSFDGFYHHRILPQ